MRLYEGIRGGTYFLRGGQKVYVNGLEGGYLGLSTTIHKIKYLIDTGFGSIVGRDFNEAMRAETGRKTVNNESQIIFYYRYYSNMKYRDYFKKRVALLYDIVHNEIEAMRKGGYLYTWKSFSGPYEQLRKAFFNGNEPRYHFPVGAGIYADGRRPMIDEGSYL